MGRTLKRSNLHFELALERLPRGVAADAAYWGDDRTVYVKRASGARLWDIDDNEYIDYRLAGGQMILGYADARVAKAARAGIEIGGVFTLATELEFAVAERIAKMVPAAERVRFSTCGAEAVVDALRLARKFTRKPSIAVGEGGTFPMLGAALWEAGEGNRATDSELPADGRDVRAGGDAQIHYVPDKNTDRLHELLLRHGSRIGALLLAPFPRGCTSQTSDAEYLCDVRALCDRYEIALILDETETGFRAARGGAQELLGVRADLCIFGSSMASGYPIAALAGREEIMRMIGKEVAQCCDHAPHPVALAAADKTLSILDRTDVLKQIAVYGWRMREGMAQVLSRRGIQHAFAGPPTMSHIRFGNSASSSDAASSGFDAAFRGSLALRLHASGILCDTDLSGPWFVSAAHDELCLAETLAKFERAADATLECMPERPSRTEMDARPLPVRS